MVIKGNSGGFLVMSSCCMGISVGDVENCAFCKVRVAIVNSQRCAVFGPHLTSSTDTCVQHVSILSSCAQTDIQ